MDPILRTKLPIALYARLSVNPDGTKDSVGTQVKVGRKECAQRWPGREILEFIDDGITAGDDTVYRPGYEAMLTALRNGEVGDVITRTQARISRHELIWPVFKIVCLAAGITHLHTWTEGTLPMLDGESMGADVTNLMNAHFRKVVKKNVNETLGLRAIEGRPAGGKPYGYRLFRIDGRVWLQTVPEQAALIEEMADRVLRGHSLAAIARWLNEQKVPTPKTAKAWTGESVKGAITNATVTGLRVHQGKVIGDGEWEAILERDKWERVRAKLNQPREVLRADGVVSTVTGVKHPSHTYLLSGFCTCDLCTATMTTGVVYAKSGLRIPSYVCKSSRGGCNKMSVKGPETEAFVVENFIDYVGTPAFRRFLKSVDRDRPKRERLKAQKAAALARQNELAEAYADDDSVSLETVKAGERKTREKVAGIEAALRDLESVPMETDARVVKASWEHLELGEQQELLRAYRTSVVVSSAVLGKRFSTDRLSVSFGGQ